MTCEGVKPFDPLRATSAVEWGMKGAKGEQHGTQALGLRTNDGQGPEDNNG